ncbi:MAG: hypothetical protein GC149_15810 [Gammaproteobacteria bacterium]|nr:hypothetical protein [Gammaproteobacteria bacterium]
MPGYKATVIGENFEFVIDDEPQFLDFSRTVYIDAEDEDAAQVAALAVVREELLAQAMLDDEADQSITIEEISQADVLADKAIEGDFIWYFPDDDEDE